MIQNKILITITIIFILYIVGCSIYHQIKEHYDQTDEKLKELRDVFTKFFKNKKVWKNSLARLNNRDIMNEIHIFRGNTSYTINKKCVHICLKDKEGNYYSDNMLIYVLAHELAHVICEEIGHTELFNKIFAELKEELENANIYDDNLPLDNNYCKNGDKEISPDWHAADPFLCNKTTKIDKIF